MNSRQDREFLLYLGEAVSSLFHLEAQGGASELRADKFDKRLQNYREWCEQDRDISLSPAERKKREIENRDREEEREAQERETAPGIYRTEVTAEETKGESFDVMPVLPPSSASSTTPPGARPH